MTRSLLTALLVALLALGSAGCGGDDDGDDSSGPSDPSSSAGSPEPTDPTSTAPTEPTPTVTDPDDDGDDSDDGDDGDDTDPDDADDAAALASMQTSLDALVDPKTTPRQKAARVVGGGDLAPLFRQFAQGGGSVVFSVDDPDVDGRFATADVGATLDGQPFAEPEETPFVLVEGEWRLERRTVCIFATQVGLQCPPR